jgi:hypothetical protein
MPHRRSTAPRLFTGDDLTRAMVGIGMNFAAHPLADANIEDTIVSASVAGMIEDDLRVLAVLATWLSVHHAWVNADRLIRALHEHHSERLCAFWSAVGNWLAKDRRLSRLLKLYRGPRVDLLRSGSDFQIRRRGEDTRFKDSALRVPGGVLRDRPADVLAPRELAARHTAYRLRMQMGPSYRADMWALISAEPGLTPSQLADRAYGSFATAWQVRRDFQCLVA